MNVETEEGGKQPERPPYLPSSSLPLQPDAPGFGHLTTSWHTCAASTRALTHHQVVHHKENRLNRYNVTQTLYSVQLSFVFPNVLNITVVKSVGLCFISLPKTHSGTSPIWIPLEVTMEIADQ
ncbi:hypothetical protein E2C01_017091 [Portunus trituberculatus]|uniref:Uncharacterized protein n=1 Tax=Portunus trituberculatus TaxID=210409 RepID=A0A5B7DQZ4_PORTR|nr:hypothetical protein [Portunus trituberculatus]